MRGRTFWVRRKGGGEVGVQDPAPLLQAHLLYGLVEVVAHVVDQDPDPPQVVADLLHQARHLLLPGEVGPDLDGPHPQGLRLLPRGLGQALGGAVVDGHGEALPGQGQEDGPADPLGASRHQRDPHAPSR
jgi:hypothetical protein